ncbi:NUDIX hydrolase [Candidatus Parcubacteria bacterium]|nr:NUDIX hydrolase [Candidatus Parcubacteria bacterium]
MIFLEKPEDFNKKGDIVGCYIEHDGAFLVLRRHAHKSNGGCWGLPAGKAEPGEAILEAIEREIREETGLSIPKEELTYFASVPVRHGTIDFDYHMFSVPFNERPDIAINVHEHKDYAWVTPKQALQLPLVEDQDECVRRFYAL